MNNLLTDYDKIKNDPDFTIIGHMTEAAKGVNLITGVGSAIPLVAKGWEHGNKNDKVKRTWQSSCKLLQ